MFNEKLLDFKYYYDKLPLYLQQSSGFVEHFKYWIELLQGLDKNADDIVSMINIFSPNKAIDWINANPNCSDFLNKIGLLFGVNRNMIINNVDVKLDDTVFLLLLRAQIVKSFYNGTYEQLNELYFNICNLPIFYITKNNSPLEANIVLITDKLNPSITGYSQTQINNITKLFDNHYLTTESMGIVYTLSHGNLAALGHWDTAKWGINEWGI